MSQEIESLTQAQKDRLAFIELRLRFMGSLRRQDLASRFGMQEAAATRDISLYRKLAANNIQYNSKQKTYLIGDEFKPLFEPSAERVMSWLTRGFGDGAATLPQTWIVSDCPSHLSQPDLGILANVTRAMYQGSPLAIQYHSLSSGVTHREIVPFALIDTGIRWHVRAFDRKTQDFRDFVITRIRHPKVLSQQQALPHETSGHDLQWNRMIEIALVPHPDQPYPEVALMDYGMKDGALKLTLRAATVGYTLRKWGVDCSSDHRLRGHEHRLWLANNSVLRDVKNAVLTYGYEG